LVEPYQPASIGVPSVPGNMSATARNQNVILAWSGTNIFYNIYRGTNSGGPYTKIASLSTNSTYSDSAVVNGLQYFYVVTGLNILTQESAYSIEASARPVSTSAPQVSFVSTNNAIQLSWPFDHTGWRLMVQTNQLNVGLGTNWFFVSGSNVTNLLYMPIDQSVGSLFFQLTYP
jgi:fibronectin type 3 domain-containing protein